MNRSLTAYLATTILEDRIHHAERERLAGATASEREESGYRSVTVRLSRPGDERAIRRLEQLEGWHLPAEPTLVAEAEGRVLAARSVSSRDIVADPFQPTMELVELLDLRSIQLRDGLDCGHVAPSGHRLRRFLRAVTEPLRS
jgi:hypothetical protein